jgi:acyl-CoA reductase-like NAD-dependent aldehyde dehydrogenase
MVQGVTVENGVILDVNPSTGALIEKVKCSTPDDVTAAVAAARAAHIAWNDLGLNTRHAMLSAAMAKLGERPGGLEALAVLITQEMGKVISEAREEVEGAANKEEFLKLVRAANEDELIDPASGTTVVRDPHGVVAVISPWNFPADEILLLVLPALMAGNCVVVKPSEVTHTCGNAMRGPLLSVRLHIEPLTHLSHTGNSAGGQGCC